MMNRNIGPEESADILADVVSKVKYKPGWCFSLNQTDRGQGCQGLTLHIAAEVPNSMGNGTVGILHLMPVLPAAYNRTAWEDWVFEQIQMVEYHEAMEFFQVDGVAPYFSDHGPGRNPYARMRIKDPSQPAEEAEPYYGREASDPFFNE